MLARLRSINIADRRDVLLFLVVGVLLFGVVAAWSQLLTGLLDTWNNLFVLGLVLLASVAVAFIAHVSWGRNADRRRARFMVRLGLAMQIFGTLITPIGLYFETNPIISVPIGFASFLVVFFGVFIAGFGGNMLAPPRV